MITLGEIFMIHNFNAEGLNISEIARRLGLDRKTVHNATMLQYDHGEDRSQHRLDRPVLSS